MTTTSITAYRTPGTANYVRPDDLVIVQPATGRRIIVRVNRITIPDELVDYAVDNAGALEPELVTIHAATVATIGGNLHPQRGQARAFTAAAIAQRVTGRRLERILAAEADRPRPAGPTPARPRGARR